MASAAPAVTPKPTSAIPARSNVLWLLPTGLFALAAIGILWALPRPDSTCILIYPAPPGCAEVGDTSVVIPFLVLIVFAYAAIVACALLVTRPRGVVLGILTGVLGLLFLIGLATVLAAADPGPIYYY
jgi:hypothetical protein